MIRRLRYEEIDFDKYTSCLENSAQRTAYAQAGYLEVMCGKSWELLVFADYEAVMPVPIVKKFGVRFVVRPIGIQQLGVFSAVDDPALNMVFYRFLKDNFLLIDYAFNEHNSIDTAELLKFKNYVIDPAPYESVKKKYHADRRRNVRISEKDMASVNFAKITEPETARDFYLKFAKGISENDAHRCFMKFTSLAYSGIVSFFSLNISNEMASLGIILESEKEVCAVTLCHDPQFNGRNAPSLLVDGILRHYMPGRRFSFMGSNIPTVAAFNSRFGAAERLYSVYQSPRIRYLNKLKSIHLMFKNNLKKVLSL